MNDPIETRLRTDLQQVDGARLSAAGAIHAGVLRAQRQRVRRRQAAMASVSAVLVGVAAFGIWQAADREPVAGSDTAAVSSPSSTQAESTPPTTDAASTVPTTAAPVPINTIDPTVGGWTALPVDPRGPDYGGQVVWTGTEAISIGGADQSGKSVDSVAAYNPTSEQWRIVTNVPSPLMWPLAVWTGSDVLIVGWRDGLLNTTAATLDVTTGEWTQGAQMPFGFKATRDTPHVWTGSELLLWADRPVVYDPVTDTWRTLADAPIDRRLEATSVWTGSEWIVWGGLALVDDSTRGDGAAYDPVTDTWRVLTASPLSKRIVSGVWTGTEVLMTAGRSGDGDGVMAFSDGAAYNPSTDSWRPLSAGYAHPGFSPVWTGDRLLLFAKGGAVVYDPAADQWSDLFPGEAPEHDDTSPVWTGSVALLLGSYQGSTGGATLTLPPR